MISGLFVLAFVLFVGYWILKIFFAICKAIYDIPKNWRQGCAEYAEKQRRAALTPAQRAAEEREAWAEIDRKRELYREFRSMDCE